MVTSHIDRQVNNSWFGAPDPLLQNDNWSARWSGTVLLPVVGDYTFYITSFGPQKLFINGGAAVIDDRIGNEQSYTYHAASAGPVTISYEMADDGGQAISKLEWATPFVSRQLITSGYLSTGAPNGDGKDDNFHEKSLYGSFKPGAGFSIDNVQSPAIDRGRPGDPFNLEPANNDGYVNVGTYGNSAEASKSPAQYVLVANPNGGERLAQKTNYSVRWRSNGFAGNVNIEHSTLGYGGPFTSLVANTPNTGTYNWFINQATFSVSDQYVIRITSVGTPAITDVTDAVFSVTPPIAKYYVNDAATAGDEYTTAIGNDANDGLTSATPKASIRAILETYDLEFGDTLFVDNGIYSLTTNIPILHADSGVTIKDPTGAGHSALLDRGNVSGGSYVFELNDADAVTLSNLSITGAFDGIYVNNGSGQLTLQNSRVFENANSGLNINDAASFSPVIKDNLFYGDASNGNKFQKYGVFSRAQDPTFLRNQAYHNNGRRQYGIYLENAGTNVVVHDNVFWNNSDTGLLVSASDFDISGNIARDNNRGFYINDTTANDTGQFHDNAAFGNTNTGMEFHGYGEFFNSEAYDNTTGFYTEPGFPGVVHDVKAYRNITGINTNGGIVRNSRAYGNSVQGIYLYGSSVTISNNFVYDNLYGIQSQNYNGDSLINNNTVYDNSGRGIFLDNIQTSGGTMRLLNNSVMELSSDALDIGGSSQNITLKNNIFWSGGAGHYAVNVADSAQKNFASDYNDLYFTNGAKLGLW